MYEEEEREARRRVEDVDRLRRARHEWRENYDELNAGWTDEEHIEEEYEISRKEADKVTIRNRQRYMNLNFGSLRYHQTSLLHLGIWIMQPGLHGLHQHSRCFLTLTVYYLVHFHRCETC